MEIPQEALKRAQGAFLSFLRLVPLPGTSRWFGSFPWSCSSKGTLSSFWCKFHKIPHQPHTETLKKSSNLCFVPFKGHGCSTRWLWSAQGSRNYCLMAPHCTKTLRMDMTGNSQVGVFFWCFFVCLVGVCFVSFLNWAFIFLFTMCFKIM